MSLEYNNAVKVMDQFKTELEEMRSNAKEDDTLPAPVFFMFMDTLIPAFDGIIAEVQKIKGELDECSKAINSRRE